MLSHLLEQVGPSHIFEVTLMREKTTFRTEMYAGDPWGGGLRLPDEFREQYPLFEVTWII